jgi:cell division protease FtsH
MSETLGAAAFGHSRQARFLEGGLEERNYSEETARAIDADVKTILHEQHERARRLLAERRQVLESMVKRLLEVETLNRADLEALVGPEVREKAAAGSGRLGT